MDLYSSSIFEAFGSLQEEEEVLEEVPLINNIEPQEIAQTVTDEVSKVVTDDGGGFFIDKSLIIIIILLINTVMMFLLLLK